VTTKRPYMLDSDVFIAAKNSYYAFAICPGFWDSLIGHHRKGNVCSIDRVKGELLAGRKTEDLVQWVKNELPAGFFVGTNDGTVMSAYRKVILWVQDNPQYAAPAKNEFAKGADGWLVAYAMAKNVVVVTNEQRRPKSRSSIKLPDVCNQFNVECKDTFGMLKDLAIRFEWTSPYSG
jgi:hypothetical protein